MQWRLIGAEEADRYDRFVARAATGDIMQSFAWGEIKSEDWRPFRGVVENDRGEIKAAALLLIRRVPVIGGSIAYAPRGPVVEDTQNQAVIAFTLQALANLARQQGAFVLKVDPAVPEGAGAFVPALRELGFRRLRKFGAFGGQQPRYTFRLSLQGSEEEIFSRFSKKMRYKIRYAPAKGLEFRADEDTGIEDFFAVLSRTGERNHFLVRTPQYFQKIYRLLKQDGRVLLLTGYLQGKPVVSSLTFSMGDKCWAVYGGQSDEYRNLYTYHALNWERIRWAKAKGAAWFDFYGVPPQVEEGHPFYGLYKFKESFGGDFVAFIGEWNLPLNKALFYLWDYGLPTHRKGLHRIHAILLRK